MSFLRKPSRTVRLLTKHGPEALKATLGQIGMSRKPPLIPTRIGKTFRKDCLVKGTYGSFVANEGGWDPAWDAPRRIYPLRPWKGHKRERTREDRFQKIEAALKTVPAKIEKYEMEVNKRKPVKDILYQFKRVTAMAKIKGGDFAAKKAAGGGGGSKGAKGTKGNKKK